MKTLRNDTRLPDALAAVLGYLRMDPAPPFDAAPRDAADRVVEGLARHLRREEEILKEIVDESLPPLKAEHDALRNHATALARRLAEGDRAGAEEVGRRFLMALVRHLERSEAVLGSALDRLPVEEVDRLLRRAGRLSEERDED